MTQQIINLLNQAQIKETPFGVIGQGVQFVSEQGTFRITLLANGVFTVYQRNVGHYDTGVRIGNANIEAIEMMLDQHNVSSFQGLSGLAA